MNQQQGGQAAGASAQGGTMPFGAMKQDTEYLCAGTVDDEV